MSLYPTKKQRQRIKEESMKQIELGSNLIDFLASEQVMNKMKEELLNSDGFTFLQNYSKLVELTKKLITPVNTQNNLTQNNNYLGNTPSVDKTIFNITDSNKTIDTKPTSVE